MIAALPMYDWPEVRAETDALWSLLRDALRGAGIAAPERVSRPEGPLWPIWEHADLTLAQTCGLPFAARLSGAVSLLGAPSYDLPGCAPGQYRSEIVVRADDGVEGLDALRGHRFAFNMRESQSGWAALAAVLGEPQAVFAGLVETGAHRASLRAVAEGRADVAAIDAVSWRLALRHDPAAARLRVLGQTVPTPGLPYITARRDAGTLARMQGAVAEAIGAAPVPLRDALFLTGFQPLTPMDYAPLAVGWPT